MEKKIINSSIGSTEIRFSLILFFSFSLSLFLLRITSFNSVQSYFLLDQNIPIFEFYFWQYDNFIFFMFWQFHYLSFFLFFPVDSLGSNNLKNKNNSIQLTEYNNLGLLREHWKTKQLQGIFSQAAIWKKKKFLRSNRGVWTWGRKLNIIKLILMFHSKSYLILAWPLYFFS